MIKVVAGLIINHENKVLITQRSSGKSYPLEWEFPGGKIEQDETNEAALAREIREELSADITGTTYFGQTVYHYPELSVELYFYRTRIVGDKLILHEHHSAEWIEPRKLSQYQFLAADKEIINKIIGCGDLFFQF